MLDTTAQDIRYAVRTLSRRPSFAIIAVLVLAVGIGLNAAVFSIVNALLFRPLPVKAPQELAYMYFGIGDNSRLIPISGRQFDPLRKSSGEIFSELTGHAKTMNRLTVDGGTEHATGEAVLSNYFSVLGITPLLGRTFAATEDNPATAERAIVISHRLWTRRFGANPHVLGKTVVLDDVVYTIVGVTPEEFKGITAPWEPSQFWVTTAQFPSNDLEIAATDFPTIPIGRLRPGVDMGQARAAFSLWANQIKQSAIGRAPAKWRHVIETYRYYLLSANDVKLPFDPLAPVISVRVATALMATVLLVFVIAVTNISGLLLSRATARHSEMAVRLAMGAGRVRITRQMLTETLVLATGAGAIGLVIANALLAAFHAYTPARFTFDVPLDFRVMAFVAVVCGGAGLLVSLAPAHQLFRTDILSNLRGMALGTTVRQSKLRHWMVIPQIALLVVLLVGSGIYLKDLIAAQSESLGYEPRHRIVLPISLGSTARPMAYVKDPQAAEKRAERTRTFYRQLMGAVSALPFGTSVSLTSDLPLREPGHWSGNPKLITDRAFREGNLDGVDTAQNRVSPKYFSTMGITLAQGRDFDERDGRTSPLVAIVSESLARRAWGSLSPLGRSFALHTPSQADDTLEWREVVGVVHDVSPILRSAGENPHVYFPLNQDWQMDARQLVAHVTGDVAPAMRSLANAVASADTSATTFNGTTMTQMVAEILYPRRLAAGILSICAAFGFAFASIGLYAVVAYSVSQRVREIGVRAVLGAQRLDIIRMVGVEGAKIVVLGCLVGLPLTWGARTLAKLAMPSVPPLDAWTCMGVTALLVAIVAVACYLPARRAARLDPAKALRVL